MKAHEIFWTTSLGTTLLLLVVYISHWFVSWIPLTILFIYILVNVIPLTERDEWSLDLEELEPVTKYTITYWLIVRPILLWNRWLNKTFK